MVTVGSDRDCGDAARGKSLPSAWQLRLTYELLSVRLGCVLVGLAAQATCALAPRHVAVLEFVIVVR